MPAAEAVSLHAFSNRQGLESHQAPHTEHKKVPSRCRMVCELCRRAATARAASLMPAFLWRGWQLGRVARNLRASWCGQPKSQRRQRYRRRPARTMRCPDCRSARLNLTHDWAFLEMAAFGLAVGPSCWRTWRLMVANLSWIS